MKNQKVYTIAAVNDAVNTLANMGYDIQILPGALCDSYICIAPDENRYNYIFKECYINCWASGYTVRRYSKIPEWAIKALETVDA